MFGHYALSEYAFSEFPQALIPPPSEVSPNDGYKRGERKKHQELLKELERLRRLRIKAQRSHKDARRLALTEQIAPELLPKKEADVSRVTLKTKTPEEFESQIFEVENELAKLNYVRWLRHEHNRLYELEQIRLREIDDEETLLLLI